MSQACSGQDGYSLAEAMAGEVEERWLEFKGAGNAALADDPARAADLYMDAWYITMQPYPQLDALQEVDCCNQIILLFLICCCLLAGGQRAS